MEKEYYIEVGNSFENAQESQMFGKPCFKINKKAFVSFFENDMVFKLMLNSEIHQEALSLDGSKLFDPSGKNRPMKEWVQVPFDYKKDWQKFAQSALEYVEG